MRSEELKLWGGRTRRRRRRCRAQGLARDVRSCWQIPKGGHGRRGGRSGGEARVLLLAFTVDGIEALEAARGTQQEIGAGTDLGDKDEEETDYRESIKDMDFK